MLKTQLLRLGDSIGINSNVTSCGETKLKPVLNHVLVIFGIVGYTSPVNFIIGLSE